MSERVFTATGKTCVDCNQCCWDEKLGMARSKNHLVNFWRNHLALNINISTHDYGMPIAVCGAEESPKQDDQKPRICVKANTPQFLKRISER